MTLNEFKANIVRVFLVRCIYFSHWINSTVFLWVLCGR